jgi:hypothetical protein
MSSVAFNFDWKVMSSAGKYFIVDGFSFKTWIISDFESPTADAVES